jgi:hypothetical protein
MKKITFVLLCLMLAYVRSSPAQAVSAEVKLVPADAQWVVHLDMKRLAATPFADKLQDFNNVTRTMQRMDILKDIDAITIIGLGTNIREFVSCWEGKFDQNKLSPLAKINDHSEFSYRGHKIHRWGSNDFGVLVNDVLALHSQSELAVKYELDVIDGQKNNMTASTLLSHWQEISADSFLCAATINLSALTGNQDASLIFKKTSLALFAAIEKNDMIKLSLRLDADSPQTAQNIQQVVQGFIALTNMKKPAQPDSKGRPMILLDRLQITVQGNVVRMELNGPAKEILELLSNNIGIWMGTALVTK